MGRWGAPQRTQTQEACSRISLSCVDAARGQDAFLIATHWNYFSFFCCCVAVRLSCLLLAFCCCCCCCCSSSSSAAAAGAILFGT